VTVGVLVIVALSAGLERGALKVVFGLIVFQLAIYLLVAGLRPGGPVPELPASESGTGGETDASRVLTLGVGAVVLLAAVIAVVVLATIWMRRTRTPIDDPVQESRTIDRGSVADAPATGRRRNRRRRREPRDATAAYVALMADLERHRSVRRDPAETPAEHASRLRAEDRAGLMLDLLAADYALVRYGGKELSPREHDRALGRWRSLRRRLTREHP
jgi:multisubunit Na+/H+ antiporter MnhC subunit